MRFALVLLTALCLLVIPLSAVRADEQRFALVVGNGDYAIGALKNPVNDARAVAAALLGVGFQTTLKENLTGEGFALAVDEFLAGVPEGAVALFYYAGHGFQLDGRNYLLPVDLKLGTVEEVMKASLPASDLVAKFQSRGVAFTIVILDACRNNPFVQDDREAGRGLAAMESTGGEILIGFSTQAGEVAFDGTGPNSPYTGALVNEIDREGRDILDVFRSVRRSVRIWTDGQQRPFISASIEREFAFRPSGTGPVVEKIEVGDLSPERVRDVVETLWWNSIKDSKVPDEFRSFAEHFPNSPNVEQARDLATQLEQAGVQVRGLVLTQFLVPAAARSPEGLSAVVTGCDVTAGDPDDPRRITDGVAWGLVNVRRGLADCAAALAADPANPRLLHQMGRVLDIQSRFEEAESFYRLAASLDYSASMVNLGFMYVAERGHERDYAQAMTFYRPAANLGNLRARTNIGEMFERGWSVEKNLDEAVLWYRLAAQNGWPNALDTLANLTRKGRDENGRGIDKNLDEAIRLYRIAAELGHTNAMNNLGQLYLSDELPEPNVEEGIRWLGRAADRGNRYAPFNLGRLYRDGKLVEQDLGRAYELFQTSADLGFAPARTALGRMHAGGDGVAKDKAEAAFQFTLAILTADGKRPEEKEEPTERLAKLGLSEADVAEIRSRAEEWLRQNGG